jgi:hypothetical protein
MLVGELGLVTLGLLPGGWKPGSVPVGELELFP